jgi:hypothetical protein
MNTQLTFANEESLFRRLENIATYSALTRDQQIQYDNSFNNYLAYIGQAHYNLRKGEEKGRAEERAGANATMKPTRAFLRYTGEDDVLNPNGVQSKSATALPDRIVLVFPDKTIYIAAAPNTPYTIVDVNGRPLRTGITATDRDEIHLPGKADGIVIVITGGKSFKIRY